MPFTGGNGTDGLVTIATSIVDQNNPYVWEIVENDGFVGSSGSSVVLCKIK